MQVKSFVSKHKNADSEIRSENVRFTDPEPVQYLLDHYNNPSGEGGHRNRPMSKSLAKLYANEWLRGAWQENGENMIFAVDGEGVESLASAQHRCAGFVMAFEMHKKSPEKYPDADLVWATQITWGVPLETVDSVDKGKTRNNADILFRSALLDTCLPEEWNASESKRKAWAKALATAARVVWQRAGGKLVSSAEKFIPSEMLTFIESEHPNLPMFVTMVLNANDGDGGHGGLKKVSLAYTTALSYLACLNDDGNVDEDSAEKVEQFLDNLAQGGAAKGSPAHALAGFWNSLPSGSKDRDLDISAPIVKTLNLLLDGKETGCKVNDVKLSAKERKEYRDNPIMLCGWDTICFDAAAAAVVEAEEEKERERQEKEAAKAAAKEEREKARAAARKKKQADAKKKKAAKKKGAAGPAKTTSQAAQKAAAKKKKGTAAKKKAAGSDSPPVKGKATKKGQVLSPDEIPEIED